MPSYSCKLGEPPTAHSIISWSHRIEVMDLIRFSDSDTASRELTGAGAGD
jgi:hypothetical protein